MKTKTFKDCNYHAVYFDGKTMRIPIDRTQPVKSLQWPEFLDVKITNKCNGNCPWCYQDSKLNGAHAVNVVEKIKSLFLELDENLKPFQVAIGGGEPTLHPLFSKILCTFAECNITPNFTTNGAFIYQHDIDELLRVIKSVHSSAAVSTHPHMKSTWEAAVKILTKNDIKTNLHVIISDKASISQFWRTYQMFNDVIEYFVLLPHVAAGRASHKDVECDMLFSSILKQGIPNNIAFGAMFHPQLVKSDIAKQYSLYDPEAFSGYLDLVDMKLLESSFSTQEKSVEFQKYFKEKMEWLSCT